MRSIVVGLPTQTSTSFASALSLTRTCFQFFDEVKIEDPRVHELCNKAGQPSPFQILCECLRRNFGMGDTSCQTHMNPLKHQWSEFATSVGHTATVSTEGDGEGDGGR